MIFIRILLLINFGNFAISFCSYATSLLKLTISEQVQLPGGKFQMGIDDFDGRNGEAPSYKTAVKPFKMDRFPVTNFQFELFVEAKNYTTEAETIGWSYVFVGHLKNVPNIDRLESDRKSKWMIKLNGTTWRNPFGPESNKSLPHHPVVHVSKRDAASYCHWVKKRLPTEFEWEYASRGGLQSVEYPWGDEYEMGRTNLWQGEFPNQDSGMDGYSGTSPVNAYPEQNNFGLYDMIGNVWEWTSSKYHIGFKSIIGRDNQFVIKGGSYLDSRKGHVNLRARSSARDGKLYNYTAGNVGFRCASRSSQILPFMLTKPSLTIHTEL